MLYILKKKKKNQYVVNYVNLEGRILIDQRKIIFFLKKLVYIWLLILAFFFIYIKLHFALLIISLILLRVILKKIKPNQQILSKTNNPSL